MPLLDESWPPPGRRAMVPATVLCGVRWGQAIEAVGPEVLALSVATATWELPELFTVAPRIVASRRLGDEACHASASLTEDEERCLLCPSSRSATPIPQLAADASTGLVVLTPEKAIVTIETWVGGLTTADGFAWPAVTTVVHAASRAPPLLVAVEDPGPSGLAADRGERVALDVADEDVSGR